MRHRALCCSRGRLAPFGWAQGPREREVVRNAARVGLNAGAAPIYMEGQGNVAHSPLWSTLMPTWYALFEGSSNDVVAFKRHFAASGFSFDEIDGKVALAAPQFETCAPGDAAAVINAAADLLNAVNVALRLSDARCNGFELCGVVERRDGKTHRVLLAGSGVFSLSAVAVAAAGNIGAPVRSNEERLVSLMGRDDGVADIAHALSMHPMTWGALTKAYETVVGTMSAELNPRDARADYPNLIAKGWLTLEESNRFYYTAGYYRHGHPKSPIRTKNPMSYEDACALIKRLVWRLVDELEPT